VDPGVLERSEGDHDPSGARAAEGPPQHVSRYGTKISQYESGPRHGFAAGESPLLGLLIAAAAAAVLSFGLGWIGANHLRVPLVFSAVVGWGIRRALAAGSGGGTPDRGPLVVLALLAIVAGAFTMGLYLDYRAVANREGAHFGAIFGDGGYRSAAEKLADLREREPDRDDSVHLVEDGTTISLAREKRRLDLAEATGIEPDEPYDFYLLEATGRKGFFGFLHAAAKAGLTLRLLPRQAGWPLHGVGTLAWWFLELLTLSIFAFTKVE
jgi:hypothetical protein